MPPEADDPNPLPFQNLSSNNLLLCCGFADQFKLFLGQKVIHSKDLTDQSCSPRLPCCCCAFWPVPRRPFSRIPFLRPRRHRRRRPCHRHRHCACRGVATLLLLISRLLRLSTKALLPRVLPRQLLPFPRSLPWASWLDVTLPLVPTWPFRSAELVLDWRKPILACKRL